VTGYDHSGNSAKGYFAGLIDAGGRIRRDVEPIPKNALVE
jgi:hypothetical protein